MKIVSIGRDFDVHRESRMDKQNSVSFSSGLLIGKRAEKLLEKGLKDYFEKMAHKGSSSLVLPADCKECVSGFKKDFKAATKGIGGKLRIFARDGQLYVSYVTEKGLGLRPMNPISINPSDILPNPIKDGTFPRYHAIMTMIKHASDIFMYNRSRAKLENPFFDLLYKRTPGEIAHIKTIQASAQ